MSESLSERLKAPIFDKVRVEPRPPSHKAGDNDGREAQTIETIRKMHAAGRSRKYIAYTLAKPIDFVHDVIDGGEG